MVSLPVQNAVDGSCINPVLHVITKRVMMRIVLRPAVNAIELTNLSAIWRRIYKAFMALGLS